MQQEFAVWRLQDGSLRSSRRMQGNLVWVEEDASAHHSIPGLLSQARLHKQQQQQQQQQAPGAKEEKEEEEEEDRAAAAAAANNALVQPAGGGSLFQTGTGKSVQVSSTSMKRALALLGGGAAENFSTTHEYPPSLFASAAAAPPAFKKTNVSTADSNSLFQTATGKAVAVSASAMNKARALLQIKDSSNDTTPPAARPPPPPQAGFNFATPRKVPASVPPFKHPRRRFASPVTATTHLLHQKTASPAPSNLSEVQFRLWSPMAKELSLVPRGKELKMPLRVTMQQFFQPPPRPCPQLVPGDVGSMTSDSARRYRFDTGDGGRKAGALEMRDMLLEAGAKSHLATAEWVENHYRWIVWKLASQLRSYPDRASGFFTVDNVFCELKYRYLREVGYGHRSIIKRICERDASPAQTMVLCVSAIRKKPTYDQYGIMSDTGRVEVTDGWYCLNAVLDVPLSDKLQAGKLFVGQKLQVSEARLFGADGGLPPLEAFDACSLMLHMNGTYRVHWAHRLGRCKRRSLPLAFKCIKADGGSVPSVCLGVSRIYPLLYRERLEGNMSVVRHARAEHSAENSYQRRRSAVIEDVISRLEKQECHETEDLSEEGARLLKSVESAADPELILADMTAEEHAILSAYQNKLKFRKQAFVEKQVQKALEDAHLQSRSVTRFLKLDVSGLQRSTSDSREGILTVWDPSDSLIGELLEGATYVVSGLKPVSHSASIHLSANKSSTWRRLKDESMKWSFRPRAGLQLSRLAEVMLHSEFDMAALILHVGDVYSNGDRQRQWIFAADGSMQQSHVKILAIDFSAPIDLFSPFESVYSGTVVGFCNLLKLQPDDKNCMYVAEASNLTIYSSKLNSKTFLHLCKPAALATRWAKSSPELVSCLQHRILDILSDDA